MNCKVLLQTHVGHKTTSLQSFIVGGWGVGGGGEHNMLRIHTLYVEKMKNQKHWPKCINIFIICVQSLFS
jgi:hypothetical protein